jgi:putative addiction module component
VQLEELEAAALELDAKARARLAVSLLSSLESLSDAENAQLWAEEAQRRDADFVSAANQARPADEVHRDVRSRFD